MEEKEAKRQDTRRNALTIGIGNQETADRFLKVKTGTYEETVKYLLDAYENPPRDMDSVATIANLQQRIDELEQENAGYRSEQEEYQRQISDLQAQLEAAEQKADTDDAIIDTGDAIVLMPNPVVAHFLHQMAEKTQSTPARILEELFLADLQNPTVNNLPYTVTSREIRRVMEELKERKEE